jgi:hypothetical protein
MWRANHGWQPDLPVPDERTSLILAFGDTSLADHPDNPIGQLGRAWPNAHVVGCSTAGQSINDKLHDDALVVTFVRFDSTTLVSAHVNVETSGGPRRSGRRLAEQLNTPGLRGAFVLSDGLVVNGTALAAGFADVLPDLPVSGGLAGDGSRFDETWTIVDGAPRSGWVSAVGFIGDDIEIGYGSGGGWDIFGPERLVTRSYGNVLYELDGRPVLGLYHEYLGDKAADLPAAGLFFPLEVRDLDNRTTVRTVLQVNDQDGSMTFAGDIAQGASAQLMRASTDSLVHGAHLAAKQACLGGKEELAIAVSCVGRRMVLGERTDEELEAALEAFAPATAMVGFYAYGELSPTDGVSELHNQTMTITTLRERNTLDEQTGANR